MNFHDRLVNIGITMSLALIGAIVGDQIWQKKFSSPETKRVKGGA
jgi:hypothetical protein